MFGPPRPNAFFVALTKLDQLAAVQTLLYSIVSTQISMEYPPEVVVQISMSLTKKLENELKPFSTRIINVTSSMKENHNIECTGMDSYGIIIYLKSNCLVLQDLSHLFNEYSQVTNGSNAVLATSEFVGSPGTTSPSILIIKPIQNPTISSQQFSFTCSNVKTLSLGCQSDIDSDCIELDSVKYIEFNDTHKPWDNLDIGSETKLPAAHQIWMKFYESSKTSTIRLEKIDGLEKNEKLQHIRITKRFKELRKLGLNTAMAMDKAREENFGKSEDDSRSAVGKKVGAMFGAS